MKLRLLCGLLAGAVLVPVVALMAQAPLPALKVYGNMTTIELSPVLLAANGVYPGEITVTNGGIPDIVQGRADAATNAETQMLRASVDDPTLRVIFTVAESFYRIVGKRSAGITKMADLKGKRITVPRNTSAHFFLVKMLATAGLTEADITIVPIPAAEMAKSLADGRADAMAMWEPEPDRAKELLGNDAVVFQDKSVYRELFNMNTSTKVLADPAKRRAIVQLLRTLIATSNTWQTAPKAHIPYVSSKLKISEDLIAKALPEIRYAGGLVPDLLDVMEEEEKFVAKERNRMPRARAELAKLIDGSLLEEARGGR
jgi:sulfonate transport system substrate-binding protein